MITQETIRRIIDSAHVEEVVGEFVRLKKRGTNYIGLCPFHTEKTPSFTVSPAKGIYKCFGCGKAGDSIRFVMEHDQLSYPEALKYLAAKFNIEVEETEVSEKDKEAQNERESMYLLNAFAAEYFQEQLWKSERGKAIAYSYFVNRGFDDKTMEYFGLGYCSEDYDAFTKAALEKGYKKEFLEKTGLTIFKDDKVIDRFRGRVIFPIYNLSGRVIGFGGRTLRSDKNIAKYVNSPESEVYSKSFQLYGLNLAKKAIVQEDLAYLVEGYTDVVSLYQSGVTNAVAPLGTSLTQDQLRLLKRYTHNVALLFDGDAAGLKAAERAIDMVLEEGMNVSVISFPEGQDPDSYSKSHSDAELKEFLVNNKLGFIDFKLNQHSDAWKSDPIRKASLMKEIIESISKIPDHLLRSLFIKEFCQKSDVEERIAIHQMNDFTRKRLKSRFNTEEIIPHQKGELYHHQLGEEDFSTLNRQTKERRLIELLLKYGLSHVTVKINRDNTNIDSLTILLSEYIISEIERDEIKFDIPLYREFYEYYRQLLYDGYLPVLSQFIEHSNSLIRELSADLLIEPYYLSENWWNKYSIQTRIETDSLDKTLRMDLYKLRLKEIQDRLTELDEQLKSISDSDLKALMEKRELLSAAKVAIAKELGTAIL